MRELQFAVQCVAPILAVLLGAAIPAAASPELPAAEYRSERTNLLVYHSKGGTLVPVKSKSEWRIRRGEILAGMQEIMGTLPGASKRCPLDVRVDSEADCGDYLRQSLTYSSEPGSRVPAYLLIPKQAPHSGGQLPAILCLHPTEMNLGKKVVVGQGGKPHCAYADELARRGFVVIAPAYPLMADYQPRLRELGYKSGTMKAIWDNIRALDLLESLPFVKHGEFGAIGHSLGGHNSIYTAVFDDRIKVIVTSSGFDSFVDYHDGDITGWTSERYMPALLAYKGRLEAVPFDFAELIGALAPRVCFVNAPLNDANFKWSSVDEAARIAGPIYSLYGVPTHLRVEHPYSAHDFPDDMRALAYQILDDNLR